MLSRLPKSKIAGLLVAWAALLPTAATAQITPDATLGPESSRVRPGAALRRGGTADLIEGGATRGVNLFHSFSEFNVEDGQRVYFANPDGIANILSRVTGTDMSDINGTLGVDGTANLFLLNPNGFNFGPNARLDLLGSFLATTGDGFLFPDGFAFGATDPQAPPLLTVSAPMGVQYSGRTPGAITVNSRRQIGSNTDGTPIYEGLSVPVGRNLSLLGGEVVLDRGVLNAPGGRVEILGLKGQGNVTFDSTNRFPNAQTENLGTTSISILNAAEISSSVKAGIAGDIEIDGDPILIRNSSIRADGFNAQTSGDFAVITIGPFTENLTVRESNLSARNLNLNTSEFGAGYAGNIEIFASNILIQNSNLLTDGFAGRVTIQSDSNSSTPTPTPTLIRIDNTDITSRYFFEGEISDRGFGNIEVTARNGSIEIERSDFSASAYVDANSSNSKTAGDITINASDQIWIDQSQLTNNGIIGRILIGTDDESVNLENRNGGELAPNRIAIYDSRLSTVNSINAERTGRIIVFADNISIRESQMLSDGFAGGIAIVTNENSRGSIRIADNTTIRSQDLFPGERTEETIQGPNANSTVRILAPHGSIRLSGSRVTTSGYASPNGEDSINAGDIEMNASNQIRVDRSNLSSNGRIGTIYLGIDTSDSTDSEVMPDRVAINRSRLSTNNSNTEITGDIVITASGQIFVRQSNLAANGHLGRIIIGEFTQQNDVVIVSSSPQNLLVQNSEFSTINLSDPKNDRSLTVGESGNIDFEAISSIELNNSRLSSSTHGVYNAGDISLRAEDEIILNNTDLFGTVERGRDHRPTDQGGDLSIAASNISLLNGSQLQSLVRRSQQGNSGEIRLFSDTIRLEGFNEQSQPSGIFSNNNAKAGDAGRIFVLTDALRLSDQAIISTDSRSTAGAIGLQSDLLLMQNNSEIAARAAGNGGVLIIESGLIVASPNQDSNISASAVVGRGGFIRIDSQEILGIREGIRDSDVGSNVIDASSVSGSSGTVEINTPNLNPGQGLIELPTTVVDASQQLAQTCPDRATPEEQGSFVRSGRSGLPATPSDPLDSQEFAVEWYTPTEAAPEVTAELPADSPDPIIEAQGWVKHADGSMEMVAAGSTSFQTPVAAVSCHE
jgi:filamentous hemagglutinin family protein